MSYKQAVHSVFTSFVLSHDLLLVTLPQNMSTLNFTAPLSLFTEPPLASIFRTFFEAPQAVAVQY